MSEAAMPTEFAYELVEDWPRLPEGHALNDVCGLAVDSRGRIFAFNRGSTPVTIFDADGSFLGGWGGAQFVRPHGAFIDAEDMLWLADDRGHSVRRFTLDGRCVLTLGIPGSPQPFMSGEPFNRPTHVAGSPEGDFYVSDGYGNARIHRFDGHGRYIQSWGQPGTEPGEFNVVHNVTCDDLGRVYVADRENHRVQIFDGEGRFLAQWNNLYRPAGLFTSRGPNPITVIGEGGPQTPIEKAVPNLGARVTVLDASGRRLARIGGWRPGTGPCEFIAPHCVVIDKEGALYVGEVSYSNWPKKFPDRPRPAGLRSLRKFRRISVAADSARVRERIA